MIPDRRLLVEKGYPERRLLVGLVRKSIKGHLKKIALDQMVLPESINP